MLRRFFVMVPRIVQIWASVSVVCMLLIALAAGYIAAKQGALLSTMSLYGSAGLVFGAVVAIWLLCLGFVFADARLRAMRPVPWVLVALLFPHLLGFLLYFVLRQPIASTCAQCGKTVSLRQPFCSWCGASLAAPNGPLTADSLQQASQ
jgi:hypothetical protein